MRADLGGGLFTRVLGKPSSAVRLNANGVGVVGVMAKVIEFYVPDRLRERRLWNPSEQCGKVIEFPSTKITAVTSEMRGVEFFAFLLEQAAVNAYTRKEGRDLLRLSDQETSGEAAFVGFGTAC